ncbi:MAG: hypothetical protein WB586_16630 [Chthoniobacterales bacterium]
MHQLPSPTLPSPTRAALMTGCNHDSIGFGVVTQESTGYPGHDSLRAMGVPERASAANWNLLSDIASSTRLPDAVPRLAGVHENRSPPFLSRQIRQTRLDASTRGDKSLVGNKGYRRYLKVEGSSHFVIDEKQVNAEQRYDGIWVLRTNTDYNAETVAHVYKALWTVEDIFRTTKSILELSHRACRR